MYIRTVRPLLSRYPAHAIDMSPFRLALRMPNDLDANRPVRRSLATRRLPPRMLSRTCTLEGT